jgi:hypothetical protein
MIAEFLCREGISTASLKRAFENAEIKVPGQGGDCEAKNRCSRKTRKLNK